MSSASAPPSRLARLARGLLAVGALASAAALAGCESLVGIEDVRPAEAGELGGAPVCLLCDGACVAAQTNDHCGGCAIACGANERCSAGVCARSMRAGSGARTMCLRDARGALVCRGANERGQLGRGTVSVGEPGWEAPSLGAAMATFAVGGEDATCFLLATGRIVCSGSNGRGALGSSTAGGDGSPVPPLGPTGPLRDVAAGPASEAASPTCVIEEPATLRCWGLPRSETHDGTFVATSPASALVRVEVGRGFACVLDQLGKIQCLGVVGEAAFPSADELRPIDAPPARAIAAGALAMCLIDGDGVVSCWGGNRFGQLGSGAASDRTTASPVPVGVGFPRPMTQIVGGDAHFCALEEGGGVVCWGIAATTGDGLGTGLPCAGAPCRVTPERVPIAGIVELAATKSVTFARRADGAIFAWGVSTAADCLLGPTCEDVTYLLPTRVVLP